MAIMAHYLTGPYRNLFKIILSKTSDLVATYLVTFVVQSSNNGSYKVLYQEIWSQLIKTGPYETLDINFKFMQTGNNVVLVNRFLLT